jgi:hypothetical protein
VPRPERIDSVFLKILYDRAFEDLYLAYMIGLTQLGLRIRAALAVPNQGRLATIIELIENPNSLSTICHASRFLVVFRGSICPWN